MMLTHRPALPLLSIVAFVFTLAGANLCAAQEAAQEGAPESSLDKKIYLIGNSLTWDCLPGLLAGDVQWHVDCGKHLQFIYDQPAEPCVKTSVIWPEALKAKQYDLLCVQPHVGTTLDEDVAVISQWLDLQPTAILILHTGWSRAADFETQYHAGVAEQRMAHTPEYFELLSNRLAEKYPDRQIRSTHAIDVLDEIWHDIENSHAPFQSFTELYRDNIHMKPQVGRYLMHNLMRIALGQPRSEQGFQIDAKQKEYLDQKLTALAPAAL
ncbi:MAG: hypothetical protein KDA45_09370 [Planctomycetales bacterium]|nr:hypothetical protein [Planctomycetales bacterium]